ncbi:hypothetical protein SeMB42_g03884 [Synchytrium endobioticum]|uniref:Uncharacterized protein n=1 Tax=Synchytrium endobioticum TaxID=286115 RepID=A0A507DD85_9FUNG|nr:hypothetical protein SeMB42_g03884 [Synchytrium endobioticum]TPX49642.1 hypothetical protein SeLEV6574_g01369 [Synchytrium endobioticum]
MARAGIVLMLAYLYSCMATLFDANLLTLTKHMAKSQAALAEETTEIQKSRKLYDIAELLYISSEEQLGRLDVSPRSFQMHESLEKFGLSSAVSFAKLDFERRRHFLRVEEAKSILVKLLNVYKYFDATPGHQPLGHFTRKRIHERMQAVAMLVDEHLRLERYWANVWKYIAVNTPPRAGRLDILDDGLAYMSADPSLSELSNRLVKFRQEFEEERRRFDHIIHERKDYRAAGGLMKAHQVLDLISKHGLPRSENGIPDLSTKSLDMLILMTEYHESMLQLCKYIRSFVNTDGNGYRTIPQRVLSSYFTGEIAEKAFEGACYHARSKHECLLEIETRGIHAHRSRVSAIDNDEGHTSVDAAGAYIRDVGLEASQFDLNSLLDSCGAAEMSDLGDIEAERRRRGYAFDRLGSSDWDASSSQSSVGLGTGSTFTDGGRYVSLPHSNSFLTASSHAISNTASILSKLCCWH